MINENRKILHNIDRLRCIIHLILHRKTYPIRLALNMRHSGFRRAIFVLPR